jgi:hypothetical protein
MGPPHPAGRGGQVKNLHLLMNNCYANYGTTNARLTRPR